MNALRVVTLFGLLCLSGFAGATPYEDALASWQSYEDVGNWLNSSFSFDKNRQRTIQRRLKTQGPSGLLVRGPAKLYKSRKGYCADAANFAIESVNRIDPSYNARWVFIRNEKGRPHHWVAAFDHDGKLYIMDYGTGRKWRAMQGVHGPYASLEEYRTYLTSLDLPGFRAGKVVFKDMPGQED